jgi:hypothetical protein
VTCLQDIASAHRAETRLFLLYVGREGERAAEFVAAARSLMCFDKIAMATATGTEGHFAEAERVGRREEMYAGNAGECLVIAWDLDVVCPDRRFAALAPESSRTTLWSPTRVCLGLGAGPQRYSFEEWLELIHLDFITTGEPGECLDALRRWTSEDDLDRPINLRSRFSKTPSSWLTYLRHDYLSNEPPHWGSRVLSAGLGDARREIDFWQHALRNLIDDPWEHKSYRSRRAETFEGESGVFQRVVSTPLRLVVPHDLAHLFADAGLERGEHFDTYDTPEEATVRVDDLGRAGFDRILIRNADARTPSLGLGAEDGSTCHVPTIEFAEEAARRTWSGWSAAFAGGVLGSFRRSDLSARRLRALRKLDSWHPFCVLSPAEAFDRVIGLMVRTYGALRDAPGGSIKDEDFAWAFRCLAQTCAARMLYLGAPGETGTRERPTY